MNLSFSDKTALVIGGSRGIGGAISRFLLEERCKLGFTYLGCEADRAAAEGIRCLAESAGLPCVEAAVDCVDESATAQFFQSVSGTLGPPDYLVYSAGYTTPVPLSEITPCDWRRVVDINLTGAFIALHSALPLMAAQRRGSIVLIGSAAIVSGGGGRADYISAKAGLEGLNRAVTREYGPSGIRCNLVHPSLIDTDLLRKRHPDPDRRAQLAKGVPLGRLGRPEDVARLVCFLLSDHAGYITGQSIFVDGGRTHCGH